MDYLTRTLPYRADASTETGLEILQKRLPPPEAFEVFFEAVLRTVEDEATRDLLRKQQDEGFRGTGKGYTWTKIWDGFTVVVYDDGIRLQLGDDFSYFYTKGRGPQHQP